jgi:RNA polymerase sigma-70 factor (ECF subfamily)
VSDRPSDADLVLLLRRRRAGAFDELFLRYKERIWRFLYHLCRQTDLADDLFQETWMAAARNAHNLREDTQLAAWLLTIARNKHRNSLRFSASDTRRRAAAGQERDVTAGATSEAAPDRRAELRQVATRVTEAFGRLAVAHREVLLLAVQDGLDTRSIATVLGLREDAVRKRLSRARAELAQAAGLEREDTGDERAAFLEEAAR